MKWLTDTITGRTILVLVLGLGTSLLLAQYLYQAASQRELATANAGRLAERLLVLAQTITAVAVEKRDETAHGMSGGPLELHWSETPLVAPGGTLGPADITLQQILLERSPELTDRGLIFGTIGGRPHGEAKVRDADHTTLISLGLEDGTWLNVTLARIQATQFTSPSFVLTTLIGAIGVLAVAILLGRWLTGPLSALALDARTGLFADESEQPVTEAGTIEVRTLAAAINEMHRRIRRMVADRTQMLAAISHDLRTPLTRLRLRANAVSDVELRTAIDREIDEMERMIDAALDFLRQDSNKEPAAPVDLRAIIQTIGDDAADLGQDVVIDLPRSIVVEGRHLTLKRAFANLIQNAIKYGGSATVSTAERDGEVEISICDDGPGIPPDKSEAVFAPFNRLDSARSQDIPGHGLGLTVARTILRDHGGDIELSNRLEGGLHARVRIPRRNR